MADIREMNDVILNVSDAFGKESKVSKMFEKCYVNTYETTLKQLEDNTVFIITGDIPAMWLRDSTCQVKHYLPLTQKSTKMAEVFEKLIERQFKYINIDPYANAFNESENGQGHQDKTQLSKWIWERKFEIDSLCYPIQLSYLFWKQSGRISHFNKVFFEGVNKILEVFETELNHEENSNYSFERFDCVASDTLVREGKGNLTKPCGLIWSAFRPSDDACKYGYLIPANMFAVVALGYIIEIAENVSSEFVDLCSVKERAKALIDGIEEGLKENAIVNHEKYGSMYAYETDGFGNYNLMDDANVPSLLSIPYLGYAAKDDPMYTKTRAFVLSTDNPFYYEGTAAKGVGSPHTPDRYIWHIALCMQGLTSNDKNEKEMLLQMITSTDADTGYMHEGFSVDDPNQFTRPWFAWANSIFSEFVLSLLEDRCSVEKK